MRSVYAVLTLLLPGDFRQAFAPAMIATVAAVMEDSRARGPLCTLRAGACEVGALLACAVGEWTAKLTAAPFERDMLFPDLSRMRPPGAGKAFWFEGR